MGNSIAQVTLIAKEGLRVLRNEIILPQLAYKHYNGEVGIQGDTINIPKPYTFVANAMDPATGVTPQDITDSMVPVTINQWYEVTGQLNDKEATLQDRVSLRRTLRDMMIPLVEKMETTGIQELTYNTSQPASVGGVTNARLDADKIVDIRTAQRINKVPLNDRANLFGMLASKDEGSLLKQEKFTRGDWTPDGGQTLKDAMLGQRYGYSYFPTQLTATPTIVDAAGTVNNGAGYPIGTKTLTVSNFSAAPPEGALLTIGSDTTIYTADAGCTTTSLKLKNGLVVAAVDTGAVALLDQQQNIFFHRNALAYVSRPLEASDGVTPGSIVVTQSFDGYSIRVEMFRNPNKKTNLITIDALWGWKLLDQNLSYKYYTQK